MVEGAVIVNDTEAADPEAGTLPVPDQPVHLYRTPLFSSAGLVTEAVSEVLMSYQLVPDGLGKS